MYPLKKIIFKHNMSFLNLDSPLVFGVIFLLYV